MSSNTAYKKISLAVLLDSYQVGGSAKVVIQNLKYLPEDISAFVVLFQRGNSTPTELEVKFKQCGIEFVLIPESFALDPLILFRLLRILRNRKVQLIESNHYKTHLLALICSCLLRIPWVAVSHGWTSENFKVRFYNFLDQITLPWADVCITSGPTIAAKIKEIIPKYKRPRCLPTAFDPEEINKDLQFSDIKKNLNFSEDEFVFGAIGRLSYEKGFDILLDACRLLCDQDVKFRIILIGSGSEEGKLLEQAKNLKIEKNVFFLGQKASEDLQSYYPAFNGLVIPSRSEGLPNVLLEAAWFKIPVVASSVGGIPQFMQGDLSQWLSVAENSVQLAGRMKKLIDATKSERDKLGSDLNNILTKNYLAQQRTKKVYRLYRAVARAI